MPSHPDDAPPRLPERLPPRWEDLTPLGRLVLSVGFVGRTAATVLERGIDRAAQIAVDSQRAFREGRAGDAERRDHAEPR